jgi:hypothetical protein
MRVKQQSTGRLSSPPVGRDGLALFRVYAGHTPLDKKIASFDPGAPLQGLEELAARVSAPSDDKIEMGALWGLRRAG